MNRLAAFLSGAKSAGRDNDVVSALVIACDISLLPTVRSCMITSFIIHKEWPWPRAFEGILCRCSLIEVFRRLLTYGIFAAKWGVFCMVGRLILRITVGNNVAV